MDIVDDIMAVRADLAEVLARHEIGLDAARPEAVARRHGTGLRTARENLADLCDPDSFVEYGALTIAAQRQRRTVEELIARTPVTIPSAGVRARHDQRRPVRGGPDRLRRHVVR